MQFICDERMLIRTARHHHFVGCRVGAIQGDYIKQYPAGHHAPTGQVGNFKQKKVFDWCNELGFYLL